MKTNEMNMQITGARKQIYNVLSNLFLGPPPSSLLNQLSNEMDDGLASELQMVLGDVFVDFIKQCKKINHADEIKNEYNNLFVVPVGTYVAPYESVFLDERTVGDKKISGLLMGPSAIDAKKWYHQAGMELSEEIKELPDHIGIELSFMAHLCEKELEAMKDDNHDLVERIRDTQSGFLESHLTQWIEPLTEKVKEKSQSAFYKSLCELADSFIHEDSQTLQRKFPEIPAVKDGLNR